MDYTTDRFLETMYKKSLCAENLLTVTDEKLDTLFETKRARLRAVMGLDRLDALHFKPEIVMEATSQAEGYRLEEGYLRTLPELAVPIYILTPANYTNTVIYIHGHGLGAVEAVDPQYANEYQKCLPITLAQAGYRVLVPELIGFNRVVARDFRENEYRGCYANTTQLLMFGITMAAVRVNEILQVIDYVKEEGCGKPILCGISGGGLVGSFTAAVSRDIAGAFISGFVNTFKGSIMSMFHCVDCFIPDILSVGEEPEIVALAYPAPLLISAGELDPIFPIEHAHAAIKTLQKIYARKNAAQKVSVEIFPRGHEISTAALMGWLAGI